MKPFRRAQQDELAGELSPAERAIRDRLTSNPTRKATPGGPNCIGCGNAGDVRGDPRRGFCLEHRRMVSTGLVCDLWTPVHWTARLPHRVRA